MPEPDVEPEFISVTSIAVALGIKGVA